MWSLSDDELREFYEFSSAKATITEQFNPLPLEYPKVTATSVASWVYITSRGGSGALASEALSSLKKSPLVLEVGRKFGWEPKLVRALGIFMIPSLVVISGLNIMAKREAANARKELAARGLLVYNDL